MENSEEKQKKINDTQNSTRRFTKLIYFPNDKRLKMKQIKKNLCKV